MRISDMKIGDIVQPRGRSNLRFTVADTADSFIVAIRTRVWTDVTDLSVRSQLNLQMPYPKSAEDIFHGCTVQDNVDSLPYLVTSRHNHVVVGTLTVVLESMDSWERVNR